MKAADKAPTFESGQGKNAGHYAIQIRTTFSEPIRLSCGMLVGKEWRKFPVRLLRCDRPDHPYTIAEVNGIPVQNLCHEADHLDLMDFHAAYAMMSLIHAQAQNAAVPLGALCLETRLVEVEVEYSYSARAVGYGAPLSLYEERRNMTWEPVESSEGSTQ